jgi:hypothetical protein
MPISNTEVTRLSRLGREQERVALAQVEQEAKDQKARFHEDLKRRFSFLEHEEWRIPMAEAEAAIAPLAAQVDAHCERLGIPIYARPRLSARWSLGGLEVARNEVAELRRLAYARIEADLTAAKAAIKARLSGYMVAVLSDGLSSEARTLLAQLPDVTALIAPVDYRTARSFLLEEQQRQSRLPYYERQAFYKEREKIAHTGLQAIEGDSNDAAA